MLTILVKRILRETPNPVVFELGACNGRYTSAIAACCLKGKPTIYSFEPDPRNVKICLKTLPANVHFIPAAVGNVTGKVPFYLASAQPNGEIGSSSVSPFKEQTQAFSWCLHEGTVQVDCWRLDDFCTVQHINYVDLLFMDIQGAERLMIEGAGHMLQTTRYLWTEFEGVRIKDEGHCYEHSSSLERLIQLLGTNWEIIEIAGGDALLINRTCDSANPNQAVDLLYAPIRFNDT